MRTMTEAIAKPMAGDKWIMQDISRREVVGYDSGIVRYKIKRQREYLERYYKVTIVRFRRWAVRAVFLGSDDLERTAQGEVKDDQPKA